MAFVTVLNRNNYPAGIHTYGPVDVPIGSTRITARMARFERLGNGNRKNGSEWTDLRDALDNQQVVLKFESEMSYDNGATWEFLMGGETVGGIYVAKPSPEEPEQEIEWQIFEVSKLPNADQARLVRATLTTFTVLGMIVQVEVA